MPGDLGYDASRWAARGREQFREWSSGHRRGGCSLLELFGLKEEEDDGGGVGEGLADSGDGGCGTVGGEGGTEILRVGSDDLSLKGETGAKPKLAEHRERILAAVRENSAIMWNDLRETLQLRGDVVAGVADVGPRAENKSCGPRNNNGRMSSSSVAGETF